MFNVGLGRISANRLRPPQADGLWVDISKNEIVRSIGTLRGEKLRIREDFEPSATKRSYARHPGDGTWHLPNKIATHEMSLCTASRGQDIEARYDSVYSYSI